MNSFRTLDLAKEFYAKIEKASISDHLREQILRASSSIALNLLAAQHTFDYRPFGGAGLRSTINIVKVELARYFG